MIPARCDLPIRVVAYTDYKSPYAFVAKNPTLALAVEYPVALEWRPYTLRIAEYLGSVDDRSPHYWRKVRYAYMDARRYANKQGLVLRGPKRIFGGYLASAGMLFAQRQGFFDAYHHETFERFWRRELDLDSMQAMQRHVERLGGDAAAFERFATDASTEREHAAIVEAAEAQGVFGVPTLAIDGELFWGNDRLELARERIEQKLQGLALASPEGAP